MKKVISLIFALIIIVTCFTVPAYAKSTTTLNISKNADSHQVSPLLYGTFIEDISYACDGGLVSNLVNNGSFEYTENPIAAWEFDNVEKVLANSEAMSQTNPNYLKLTLNGKGSIKNLGFTELYDYKTYTLNEESAKKADMGFKKGVSYDLTFYVKNVDYTGKIYAYLDSKSNSTNRIELTSQTVSNSQWSKLTATLESNATEDGGLAITFEGTGTILFDFATLIPQDSYGYKNNQWKYVSLRQDLFDALKNLNPSFIRFPGGCLCEGNSLENLYSWKNTIGPIEERPQTYNIWANNDNGNYYNNTNSMGYHEYFQLCADLEAEPIPILNVGLTCQGRNDYDGHLDALKNATMSDSEWKSYLINSRGYSEEDEEGIANYTNRVKELKISSQNDFDKWLSTVALTPGTDEWQNYVQDVLDLIEYANGDSQTTYWGALRSANGHTEPFNLKYIGLGNENWGDVYFRNFDALNKAVKEKYPKITVVSSSGTWLDGEAFDTAWSTINSKYSETIVDEHYYTGDNYLFSHNDRYDSYNRNGAGVFVGEYAAKSAGFGTLITKNTIWSAVEEASFMTGFERNSDIVKMSCYAPTFAKINANSWDINEIWFDSQDVVLTPDYYSQMLFSNNVGTKYIDTKLESDKENPNLYQSVTVDEDKQIMYVKLVNAGSKTDVTINLDGYDKINKVSNQKISNNYKSAANELNKNRVAPVEEEIDASGNSVTVKLDKNSVNVIRIAYGNNDGSVLYKLPENINLKIKHYTPIGVKCAITGVTVAVILAIIITHLITSRGKGKRKRK